LSDVIFQDSIRQGLSNWPLSAQIELSLINVSENHTYRVDDALGGRTYALRLHRPGYHSLAAIRSELAWSSALRADGVVTTPSPVPGRNGDLVQYIELSSGQRQAVLFDWQAGHEPSHANRVAFHWMGETAARMHHHARSWQPPSWFQRHTWDFATSLGDTPHWGRWRDGIGVSQEIEVIFARAVHLIERRLANFGSGPARYGLIHGDMRLANLLIDGSALKVLDFDDCGYSWRLYDAATAVSFYEHSPEVPTLIAAWIEGYRKVRALSSEDEAELPTFVLLRRLLLIAWLKSHEDTELATRLGSDYTQSAVAMCEDYMIRMGG